MTFASLLLALAVGGQVVVDYRPIYEPGEPVVFKVKGAAATASVNWKFKGVRTLAGAAPTEVHAWGTPGKYTGRCTVIDWSAKTFVDEDLEFEIKGAGPLPPTPVPPGPTPPGPTPPPAPDVAPIPVAGFRVMVTFDRDNYQRADGAYDIIYGKAVRDYLDSKCATGPNGSKDYRIYPHTVDVRGDTQIWQDAFRRPRAAKDWVLISNGKTGFEGPLPATEAAFLELCRKYEVAP